MKDKTPIILLMLIIALGAFLRFYKLDWGQGLFTHPDEYHIVASVNQLSFPNQMHPHFFSYGTATIYPIYFIQSFLHLPQPFLLGRFLSALLSTLTIFLIYQIGLAITPKKYALLAATLVALTPGLIQQAHFATPESNLTFFLFGSLLLLIKFIHKSQLSYLIGAAIFFGLALGVKVSIFIFLPTILVAIIITSWPRISQFVKYAALTLLIIALTLFLIAPYIFLDFPSFRNNIEYEGGLATGKFLVFYTRQFIDTTPVLFQLEKILPYALGPSLMIFSFTGLGVAILSLSKKRFFSDPLFLILVSFFSLFPYNTFLFAKWTRFLAPTFPFFALFTAFFFYKLSQQKINKILHLSLVTCHLSLAILWALAFFSIYLHSDVRITASNWLQSQTPSNSKFLVEGGNMIDLPLGRNSEKISLDFYNLEENPLDRQKIIQALGKSDYFLIESRRVFKNHQRLSDQFPKTAKFYNALFAGNLGFKEIKEFHSFPNLDILGWKIEIPDEMAEETWSVFDHPVIRVFQKTKQLTQEEYAQVFVN